MNRIRILPDILANKIAAGEVVERPASVVKELVENALDAAGDRIMIDIKQGGRALIRVSDNGTGMDHDDALMALERFATSKISSDEDLFAIRTLGFRGEALPSIAAVSKMTLVTRSRDADAGVRVDVQGGKILRVTETGAPAGTMIEVADLFYNTPARRKFLKTVSTEMGHIADTVSGMALGRPQVHIKLSHNGKPVRQWLRSDDAAQRAADVLGQVRSEDLLPLEAGDGDLHLHGFIAPARHVRSTARGIYLFVNGRRVRDRMLQHALIQGFSGRLVKGQYPLAVLFVEMAFDQVDVNVHPTKHEVRFADQRRVHDLVARRTAAALARGEKRLWAVASDYSDDRPAAPTGVGEPTPAPYGPSDPPWPPSARPVSPRDKSVQSQGPWQVHGPTTATPVPPAPAGVTARPGTDSPPDQQPLWERRFFSDLTVIGQYRGTYILCQSGDDLVLVDQHAAHERIVYEHLKQKAGRIDAQRLLMPEPVELGHAEARALEPLIPDLAQMGLEIEPFGGTTVVVKSHPVLLDDRHIGRLVLELAEKAVEIGVARDATAALDECRMLMACHNAVRASQGLADIQIRHMLEQLDRCEIPDHCPHGRPTWVRLTLRDVEKRFKRVV